MKQKDKTDILKKALLVNVCLAESGSRQDLIPKF